jgi:hypothetical protein
MNATKYEATYCIANSAISATSEVEKVIAKLKEAGHPITCKELGFMVYGDEYKRLPTPTWNEVSKGIISRDAYFTAVRANDKALSLTARLSQVLRHMVASGFVKEGTIKSEPYTYETEEWFRVDEQGEPETIEVWDAKGTRYDMPNPKYNRYSGRGEYRKVTKTGHKTIRTYLWVKD